jgi:TonB family protein
MSLRFSQFLSAIFFLTWMAVPILGQGNTTAKVNANGFQPAAAAVVTNSAANSDRVRDGLLGPVRRVRTEVVKVSTAGGQVVEEKPLLLETSEYDQKGNKTQNQYFPVSGSTLTGREVYKYDDKGNINEMTRLGADGLPVSKEVYKYEYDSAGNWTRMTTFVEPVENRKVNLDPTEITYRTIFYYYLDDKMAKTSSPAQPGPKPSAGAASLPAPTTLDKSKVALVTPELPGTVGAGNSQPLVVLETESPAKFSPRILKPVSKGVLNGSAMSLPTPTYPDTAKRMHAFGVVVVEVVIDENGKIISARALSGPPTLRDAAVQAANHARFSPTKLSGQPVKVTGTINYNFTLAQ